MAIDAPWPAISETHQAASPVRATRPLDQRGRRICETESK